MKGIIYKYESPSGKIYIGQTIQERKRRYIFLNINQSYGSNKINNARKKYGPESFKYEILFEYTSDIKEEVLKILSEKEVEYINKFDSCNNGYNYQEGGLSKVNILSEESRRKAALKVSKTVLQYSIEGYFIKEWCSTMDIERELKISHTLVSQNCLKKTKHCRQYIFIYKTCDLVPEYIDVSNIKQHKTVRLKLCKIDLLGNIVQMWNSISEASRELNIDRHKLSVLAKSEKEYNMFIYKLIK